MAAARLRWVHAVGPGPSTSHNARASLFRRDLVRDHRAVTSVRIIGVAVREGDGDDIGEGSPTSAESLARMFQVAGQLAI